MNEELSKQQKLENSWDETNPEDKTKYETYAHYLKNNGYYMGDPYELAKIMAHNERIKNS